MLETIREYALEALEASAEADDVRRAHAAHYLGVASAAAPGLAAADQAIWRARLEADHGNLRAAIRWSLDDGDAATALELCALLSRVLARARLPRRGPALARRGARRPGGGVAHPRPRADRERRPRRTTRPTTTTPRSSAGGARPVSLARRSEGHRGGGDGARARAAGRAATTRDAEALFQEALAVYDELGDEQGTARTLDRLGIALALAGEADRARPLFERSLELFRRLGDSTGIAFGLHGLSFARPEGAELEARAQNDESLAILRGLGDRRNVAKVLVDAADIYAELGEVETAAAQIEESLTLFVEIGDRWFWGWSLESAAYLAAAGGDAERAARLFGAADAVWTAIGAPLPAKLRGQHDRVLAEVRGRLGEDRFETAWDEGGRMPLGETIELVQPARSRPAADAPEGLTAREVEVLALVAEGLTDAEVAERLVVSIRTVHAHLRSIYRKLDVRTRSAATRYALEHDLVA